MDAIYYHSRKLTNEEMANLPLKWKNSDNTRSWGWENAKVDTAKYHPSFMECWEVNKAYYIHLKSLGCLCLKYRGKFYVA